MEITEIRSKIYGSFEDIAKTSQMIKDDYYLCPDKDEVINEAIEMIIHKLARIINSGTRYKDNYRDIQGYCELALKRLYELEGSIDSEVYYKVLENGQWVNKGKSL